MASTFLYLMPNNEISRVSVTRKFSNSAFSRVQKLNENKSLLEIKMKWLVPDTGSQDIGAGCYILNCDFRIEIQCTVDIIVTIG